MSTSEKRDKDTRTRRAILDILKMEGAKEATSLSTRLNLTTMAVRHHLYELEGEQLVRAMPSPQPRGRPAKLWSLTEAADQFFPDAHATLTTELISAMRDALSETKMHAVLTARMNQQKKQYGQAIGKNKSLKGKVTALAAIRTREGYMAEVREEAGSLILAENHCPICAAAKECSGLCQLELELFQDVLGEGCSVERTDHILAGARRCAYTISPDE